MATVACLVHPHHISLVDTHSLRAKLQHAGDPYYNVDGLPSHHGVLAPRFDVFEIHPATPAAKAEAVKEWLVVGELPGVTKDDIKIEWLGESTVFIRGTLNPTASARVSEAEGCPSPDTVDLLPLHKERHEGLFERSVTLPGEADVKRVKADIKDGLLCLRIPRKE
jgi:HSP20 family molecular chaperone IbpA